jgi:hypothetical protein
VAGALPAARQTCRHMLRGQGWRCTRHSPRVGKRGNERRAGVDGATGQHRLACSIKVVMAGGHGPLVTLTGDRLVLPAGWGRGTGSERAAAAWRQPAARLSATYSCILRFELRSQLPSTSGLCRKRSQTGPRTRGVWEARSSAEFSAKNGSRPAEQPRSACLPSALPLDLPTD